MARGDKEYEKCRLEWEDNKRSGKILLKADEHFAKAGRAGGLVTELRRLAAETGDARFEEAAVAVIEHQKDERADYEAMALDWIRKMIASGVSGRVAFARVAAEFDVPGNSFGAAWANVKRLWEKKKGRPHSSE